MRNHEIILHWSDEDRAFIAEAPELPGCMAHGEDRETALRNVRDAMRFRAARAQELRRAVLPPMGGRPTLA